MITSFLIGITPEPEHDTKVVTLELTVDDDTTEGVMLEVAIDGDTTTLMLSDEELDQLDSAVTTAKVRRRAMQLKAARA